MLCAHRADKHDVVQSEVSKAHVKATRHNFIIIVVKGICTVAAYSLKVEEGRRDDSVMRVSKRGTVHEVEVATIVGHSGASALSAWLPATRKACSLATPVHIRL
jgi:uncharacterized membrane protein